MLIFLTVVQALIAAALVTVVLMQRSEGGGLGMGGGGSPAGLMSARSASDFLTRATAILATLFVGLSILLAALGIGQTEGREIDASLNRSVTPAQSGQGDLLGNTALQPAQQPAQQPASSAPASSAPQGGPNPLQGPAN